MLLGRPEAKPDAREPRDAAFHLFSTYFDPRLCLNMVWFTYVFFMTFLTMFICEDVCMSSLYSSLRYPRSCARRAPDILVWCPCQCRHRCSLHRPKGKKPIPSSHSWRTLNGFKTFCIFNLFFKFKARLSINLRSLDLKARCDLFEVHSRAMAPRMQASPATWYTQPFPQVQVPMMMPHMR